MRTGSACLCVAVVLAGVVLSPRRNGVSGITKQEKLLYRDKVVEMFYHAYDSYMTYAYPADELMPLTCKGRVRGRDKGRGDIDHALGRFSLTLIDTLDTLAVIGAVDDFNTAVRAVIRDVTFDSDLVVSVFETNIRVLGGLLGGHFAAESLKAQGHPQLSWYEGQLLAMAEEVGQRLLPAFNTTTGLPYPKVNLRHGMAFAVTDTTTCTACAGTMLLEFAALSRATGNPEYEARAHRAMEVLWQRRHLGHNLVGTTINVHNGEWTRKDSGVGAGIDSYYEYCLKSYILLGDHEYLQRFDKHYTAIMRYISNGPLLVDVSMNSPTRMTRTFMDSLLAFWPGLQVLWGDVNAAIHTHDMLYHVTERHRFLPEAFTHDFRVHWGNHPLRPEFIESTYFLYKATSDPYYLEIGKTVIDNLERFARVPCGFAAIKDLNTHSHEDRMDSFVLAETFKYLYLLFAEEEELLLDMDGFIFNTEAHLLPLSLASGSGADWREFLANSSTNSSFSGSAVSWEEAVPHTAESVVLSAPLYCPREDRPYVLRNHYQRLMLKQCTASRFLSKQFYRPPASSSRGGKKLTPPRLSINTLDFSNREHLSILNELGIVVEVLAGGKVQVSHVMQKAKTPEDAEEGWYLMQDIMRLMSQQQQNAKNSTQRTSKLVRILIPDCDGDEILVGPALFGPDLGENEFQVAAELAQVSPQDGCVLFPGDEPFKGRIVLMMRGGCLFVQKVRNAQKAGAAGVIIADNTVYNATSHNGSTGKPLPFSMSGDGTDDVLIPAVFMQKDDAARLTKLLSEQPVTLLLTWVPGDLEHGNGPETSEDSESDSSPSSSHHGGVESEYGDSELESESGDLELVQSRTGDRNGG